MTSTEVYSGQPPAGGGGSERVVHIVHQSSQQQQSVFTPWNLFALVSIALFLAYLYYSYTSSMTLKSEEKESPFVTEVTSPEVSASVLVGDGSVKVVLMHATWCEHCRVMMPAYNAAAESTRQIRWLKIEQTNAAPILKTRTDIRGFPTIFGVRSNGEVVQYGERESRTEEALRKWALQLISPSLITTTPTPTPTPNSSSNSIPTAAAVAAVTVSNDVSVTRETTELLSKVDAVSQTIASPPENVNENKAAVSGSA